MVEKKAMYLLAREIVQNAMYKGISLPFDAVELVESARDIRDLENLNKLIEEYEPNYGYTLAINYFDTHNSQGRLKRRVDFDNVYVAPVSAVEPSPKELRKARQVTNKEIIMEDLEEKLRKY